MNRRPALALLCLLMPLSQAAELPFLDSETEYSATRIIETSEGNFEQKVHWTPDKVRTETTIEGVVLLNIVRDDLGVMWISNPAIGRCLEQPVEDADAATQLGGQYEANDVAYEELGEETLEGRKVTKYAVTAQDVEVGPNTAYMWTTEENILLKMQMLPPADAPELSFTMRLIDLETEPQDAALFESPGNCISLDAMGQP
jgi:hypothetical protein